MTFQAQSNQGVAATKLNARGQDIKSSYSISQTSMENRTQRLTDHDLAAEKISSNKLYDNKAKLKMSIAKIAMHLSDLVKSNFFEQIDELLDIEAFEEEDQLINQASFDYFIKVFTLLEKPRIPAFTVSSRGNLVANWLSPKVRVHWEFPNERISFLNIVYLPDEEENEYISFRGSVKSTFDFLKQQKAYETILRGKS